jgi:hypothetical protein
MMGPNVFNNGNYMDYAYKEITRRYPGAWPITEEEADHLTSDYLYAMTNAANFNMRIPNCEILGKILESGRFKSQVETANSFGILDPGTRKHFTSFMFGADTEQMEPKDYELYGYLGSHDRVEDYKATNGGSGGVGQYGDIIVTFKKDRLKERTTLSVGDSLSKFNTVQCSRMDDLGLQRGVNLEALEYIIPDAYQYARKKEENPASPPPEPEEITQYESYTELQFHGGLSIEDIESVTLIANNQKAALPTGKSYDTEFPADMLTKLKEHGIRTTMIREDEENGAKEYEV